MTPPTQVECISLFRNTMNLPEDRPGFIYGSRIFCEDCRPKRARPYPFEPGEWTPCATCSFVIGARNVPEEQACATT